MKSVVVVDPKSAPCVVQSLRQVRMHIEASTWCGKALEAEIVFQIPDDARACPTCDSAIAKWKGA